MKNINDEKIYLMITVRINSQLMGEFNEYWEKTSLPIWISHGAKHIGSFVNYVGGPTDQIIRIFEYDNITAWNDWEKYLADTREGQKLLKGFEKYIISMEKLLLHSIY